MSEEDWTIVSKPAVATNKWNEEEDDDVKENWDDEDEEDVSKASSKSDNAAQSSQTEAPKAAVSAKKKKQKALKEKLLQKELEMQKPKTQEELIAEKLERQRLQQESDLALAQDAFGIDSGSDASVLATIQLATRNDFEVFGKALSSKLSNYTRSPHYVPFLEELFREIAVGLEADDIKKLDTSLTAVFNEKIKLQKQQTKGKKAKKNAQEIRMERDGDFSYNQGGYDEFEDFL